MKKERYISHSFIRFRQWSRKAYAIFATLGLCVTIGQLRKNVTECALCKQQTPHAEGIDPQRETEDSVPEEDWESTVLSPTPLLFLFIPFQSLKYSYSGAAQQAVATSVLYISYKEVASHPNGTGNLFFNSPSYDH